MVRVALVPGLLGTINNITANPHYNPVREIISYCSFFLNQGSWKESTFLRQKAGRRQAGLELELTFAWL